MFSHLKIGLIFDNVHSYIVDDWHMLGGWVLPREAISVEERLRGILNIFYDLITGVHSCIIIIVEVKQNSNDLAIGVDV